MSALLHQENNSYENLGGGFRFFLLTWVYPGQFARTLTNLIGPEVNDHVSGHYISNYKVQTWDNMASKSLNLKFLSLNHLLKGLEKV